MRRSDIAAVLATSIALWTGSVGSAGLPAPSAGAAACRPGGLVDAVFRDAALQALDRLVVRAPGKTADGAIKVHHSTGHLDPQGAVWHYVSAYQVNLGLLGVLRVAPRLAPTAAQWLRWQATHTTPTGPSESVVFDHWVRASDLQESTCPPGKSTRSCPQVDAYDSTAASLLLLARAYAQATADRAVLREPSVRRALEEAAATLVRLTQPHGLPWAKPDHQVAYLMDAVEVSAGWRAWAQLQRDVYGIPQAAKISQDFAQRTDTAIQKHLWHDPSQTWRVSLDAAVPDFRRWYPDTVAQAWPLLWMDGVFPDSLAAATRAQSVWRQAAVPWKGQTGWPQRNVDPEGFWWPAVAVAARCVGDDASAAAWVARARSIWMQPEVPFAWPFQVADLQWLLWLADPVSSTGGPAL